MDDPDTFTFITNHNKEEELNPLLCGYFSKLMTNLLNFNKKQFHRYVFNTPNLMTQIISYMSNKSISEFITKILQINGLQTEDEE